MASSGSNRDDPLSYSSHSSSPIPVSDAADAFLGDQNSQIGSASGSLQNDGLLLASGGGDVLVSDLEFGFQRPEFREAPLVGTVQMYERHVFLCYKNPQTRLTICEGHDGTETSNGDVLIFPDMIRYRGLTHFDVDTFVEEVLVKDTEWLPGTPDTLMGSYVFVCSHGSRDRRCGVCGPALVSKFKEEIDARGLQGQVSVSPCSHIGGHKYAGNVIIFGPNLDGEVKGHWYGYVSINDVTVLLEQHIVRGEIVDALWRGQMGLSEEDQKKAQDIRLHVHTGNGVDKNVKESNQAVENTMPGEKILKSSANGDRVKFSEKKNNKESKSDSGKGACTRKACAMPTWFESWEREDTYAALAVIGAAVSVAVAYSCYRHLS